MDENRIVIGTADLNELRPFLQRADQLEAEVLRCRDIVPNASNHLTARFIDENQPAGPRTYIHAYTQIANAFEHADALWALMGSDHGMTPRAPFTLLRSVFESGFWGTWLLDSDHSWIRRQRGLNLELVDRREYRSWVRSLPLKPEDVAHMTRSSESEKVYRAECSGLSMNWKTADRKPSVVDALPQLKVATRAGQDAGPLFVSYWRSLSGMQHGHPYALQINGDMEKPIKIAGGQQMQVSTNDDAFILACKFAYALMLEAAELYVLRSTTSEHRT